jgi:hypothetical protein
MVAVSIPRLDLIAGSRGPHVETAIPPSPNAAVTLQRQRTIVERAASAPELLTTQLPRLIDHSAEDVAEKPDLHGQGEVKPRTERFDQWLAAYRKRGVRMSHTSNAIETNPIFR